MLTIKELHDSYNNTHPKYPSAKFARSLFPTGQRVVLQLSP